MLLNLINSMVDCIHVTKNYEKFFEFKRTKEFQNGCQYSIMNYAVKIKHTFKLLMNKEQLTKLKAKQILKYLVQLGVLNLNKK